MHTQYKADYRDEMTRAEFDRCSKRDVHHFVRGAGYDVQNQLNEGFDVLEKDATVADLERIAEKRGYLIDRALDKVEDVLYRRIEEVGAILGFTADTMPESDIAERAQTLAEIMDETFTSTSIFFDDSGELVFRVNFIFFGGGADRANVTVAKFRSTEMEPETLKRYKVKYRTTVNF